MRRALGGVLLVAAAATTTGCTTDTLCHRSWMLAHPTMVTEELVIGQDARVRAESEGAKGSIGAGTTSSY